MGRSEPQSDRPCVAVVLQGVRSPPGQSRLRGAARLAAAVIQEMRTGVAVGRGEGGPELHSRLHFRIMAQGPGLWGQRPGLAGHLRRGQCPGAEQNVVRDHLAQVPEGHRL
jgi:hypothetical protein